MICRKVQCQHLFRRLKHSVKACLDDQTPVKLMKFPNVITLNNKLKLIVLANHQHVSIGSMLARWC